jgi:flagellar biosynthesis protein FlhB
VAAQQGEKTEKPTGRRLLEARKRGQIPRSKDLLQVASMVAALIAVVYTGPSMVGRLGTALHRGITDSAVLGIRDVNTGDLTQGIVRGLVLMAWLTAPILGAAVGGIVLATTAQGGWVFASEALKPDWSKLNPANGLSRLGFARGGTEMIKAVILTTVIGYVAYGTVTGVLDQSPGFARMSPAAAAVAGWDAVRALLQSVAVGLGFMALGDYGLQRWRVMSSLKMTKDEIRDEGKLTDGNPLIKARVRKVQREMARRRMLKAAAKATVIITNPTHYAVALEYDRQTMPAPRVVAKGRGFLALRIKEIAREHEVPTIQNVPLAQALYKTVEVGDTIPAALFTAVAEVLSYLIRLKRIRL